MEKGKGVMTPPHTQMDLKNFIIWNTRGENSANFRRQCEAMVKLYKPTMLVLFETKMAEYKHLTKVLKFDTQIQSAADIFWRHCDHVEGRHAQAGQPNYIPPRYTSNDKGKF